MKLAAPLAVAILGVTTFLPEARAEKGKEVFIPVGGSIGYGLNPKKLDDGVTLGGEVSAVVVDTYRLFWGGGYADVVHDFGSEATRLSIGPEIGWAVFGIDGGVVLSTLDGAHAGFCGRFLLSFVFAHAFIRLGHIIDAPREGTYGEVGVMFKLPIPLGDGNVSTTPRRPDPAPPTPPRQDLPIATTPSAD